MKLIEALQIGNRRPRPDAPAFRIHFACGFTPLHMETFLRAHMRSALPDHSVSVSTGLFGDLAGNLERIPEGTHAVAVAMEWPDLDARMGVRVFGGWSASLLPDIVASCGRQLTRIEQALGNLNVPVAISLPTLPLPPVAFTSPRISGEFESEIRYLLACFARSMGARTHIAVLSREYLDSRSTPAERFDIKSEIQTGFPYTASHADHLAESLVSLLRRPEPKKGLITDLDDTLWLGIVGDIGVDAVCWGIDQSGAIHGLYQQFVASLASAGTLVAAASKNTPSVVDEVFRRADILLPRESVFPFDVHWGPKSESVHRILKAWNIGADAVVFVDDSPMEVAEVQAAFPQMECIVFPKNDARAVWNLLHHLRETYGKRAISAEDNLRLSSIRTSVAAAEEQAASADLDGFLRNAEAEITIDTTAGTHERTLELINKTNQFNLNGRRINPAEWSSAVQRDGAFVAAVSYKDRFGPLGVIAVLAGLVENGEARLEHWVMSCRAFSRRIEHRSLEWLFRHLGTDDVEMQFVPTERNVPLQEFLRSVIGDVPNGGSVRVRRATFEAECPALFHKVREI